MLNEIEMIKKENSETANSLNQLDFVGLCLWSIFLINIEDTNMRQDIDQLTNTINDTIFQIFNAMNVAEEVR